MARRTLTRLIAAGFAAAGIAAGALTSGAEKVLACPPGVCIDPVITDKAADLFVVDVNAVPGSGSFAHQIITFSVRNGGQKPAANFQVLVSQSICGGMVCFSQSLGSVMDANLPAGQTHTYTIIVPDPNPGMTERNVTVFADSLTSVSETNESNNKRTETFTW